MWFASFTPPGERTTSSSPEADTFRGLSFALKKRWGGVGYEKPTTLEGDVARLGTGEGRGISAIGADAWAWATDDALWISRGPTGGRPVYLARRGHSWFASTSLDYVRHAAGLDRPADKHLAERLTWVFSPEPRTGLYEGVITLASRDVLCIDADGLRWMRRQMPDVTPAHAFDGPAASYLWSNIVQAVSRALGEHKRPALMISGGMDSSGVIAATQELGRLGSASCFPHWLFDGPCPDLPYARAVADHFGIKPMWRSDESWPDAWPDALTLGGAPYGMLAGAPESDGMRAAVSAGADVLLTGFGGDESMGGVAQSIMRDRSVDPRDAFMRVAKLRMSWPTSMLERCIHYAIRPALRPHTPMRLRALLNARAEKHSLPWVGEYTRDYLRGAMRAQSEHEYDLSTTEGRYRRMSETPALMAFSELRAQIEQVCGNILRLDPLFDDRLVAAVASISPYTLYSDDRHRGLYRRCLKGRVPDMVPERRDKAYFEHAFGRAWLRARHKPAFAELAQGRHLASRGLVDRDIFVQSTQRLWATDDPYLLGSSLVQFWPAFSVEQFLERR